MDVRHSKRSGLDSRLTWSALLFIILVGFALRLHFFDASRAVGEVQYRSAIIARALYFERTAEIADWRREVNREALKLMPVKEPSITETFVSWLYSLSGGEHLWIDRLLRTSFWLVGGALLYHIIRRSVSAIAALVSLGYYLLVPTGVFLSASLQPDSLMILLFVAAITALWLYGKQPTSSRLLLASLLSGLAILVKPLIIFATGIAFLLVALHHIRFDRRRTLVHLAAFAVSVLVIGSAYYLYGILAGSHLQIGASRSFVPSLLLQPDYWRSWLSTSIGAVGLLPLLAALIGFPMLRDDVLRATVTGLWIGYVIFCLTFTFHIRLNRYYHAQLIIIVALSAAPLITLLFVHLRKSITRPQWWTPVLIACAIWTLWTVEALRNLYSQQPPVEDVRTAIEVGRLAEHSSRTAFVATYYGRPLMYFGELAGEYWPRRDAENQLEIRASSVTERLEAMSFWPEYFVITNLVEYGNHHQDLEEFLTENCTLKARSVDYLIYHACTK